uniref:Uncharacterized protein n=1 Tax=Anguilla anguilla TaxID=7936 RepID=A0A0E9RUX7_ANGAN
MNQLKIKLIGEHRKGPYGRRVLPAASFRQ